MKKDADALQEMENLLDKLLLGHSCDDALDEKSFSQSLQPLAEKLNVLSRHLSDSGRFTRDIAHGNLDADPPGRRNYISAPVKEIHSQLTSFCWSIEQLIQGNMVSKLHYPGELFEWYNKLIEKVSLTFGSVQSDLPQWGNTVTSWRYHQILSAIYHLHIMILEVNAEGKILFSNPPARDALPDMDRLPYGKDALQEDALIKYLCSFSVKSLDIEPGSQENNEFPVLNEMYAPNTGAWYKITSDRVALTDGSWGILHMIDDISEWKHNEHQLRLSATIDPLTQTYTRKAGFQKLEEIILMRHHQKNCVAFVDIDGLKIINDLYGHTEGDIAIKTIADILSSCLRGTDWVVRYGGDEFLLLFFNCEKEAAQEIIDRMYRRLDIANELHGKPYSLSFSYGLSSVTEDIAQIPDLIGIIDSDMYANKKKRKADAADS